MARISWTGTATDKSELNGGYEFNTDDQLTIESLNQIVNNGLHLNEVAEATTGLATNQPDNTNAGVVGTPTVEIIGTGSEKKFKFSNLKGATGATGATGEQGPQGIQGEAGLVSQYAYNSILPYTSWTGASAPYTKAITISGILSTDKLDVDLDLSSSSYGDVATIQTDWANIYRAVASTDTITFYASAVPTIDIPLQIKVVR